MAEFPALPLWTDAYLADTIHLTEEQHGIYMLLLMHCWRTPGCKIPNDDEWIALRFRRPIEWVREHVRPLLDEFFMSRNAMLSQKRLTAEHKYVTQRRLNRTRAAKSRWDKEKASSNAHAMQMHPQPTPTPIEREERKEEAPAAPDALSSSPDRKNGSTDARTLLFQNGVDDCAALTGRPHSKVRALVGRWLKLSDDDALRVLTLIAKAKQDRPAEPVAWIEGHLRPRAGPSAPMRGAMLGRRI